MSSRLSPINDKALSTPEGVAAGRSEHQTGYYFGQKLCDCCSLRDAASYYVRVVHIVCCVSLRGILGYVGGGGLLLAAAEGAVEGDEGVVAVEEVGGFVELGVEEGFLGGEDL